MSRPLDTSQRREVVHTSPEIAAAKHIARSNGLHMRRLRRVGPIRFTVGDEGLVQFSDSGRLTASLLGRVFEVTPLFAELDTLMAAEKFWDEARTLADVDTMTIILPDLPADAEPMTGPVPVDTPLYDVMVLTLPEDASAAVRAQDSLPVETAAMYLPLVELGLERVVSMATASIQIIEPTLTSPAAMDLTPHTREIAIIEAKAQLPSGVGLWTRFFFGVLMFISAMIVGASAPLNLDNEAWIVAVSVAFGSLAVLVIAKAIHENDLRLAALRTAGLR